MEDDEEATAAMAAAMGFSSFGGPKSNKRRKFNPGADAVVDDSSTSSIPLHNHNLIRESASGSNATPLGTRTQNTDKINLEDDEEEEYVAAIGGTQVARREDDDDPAPQYIDTSRPSAPVSADVVDGVQSKIDDILGTSSVQGVEAPSSVSFRAGGGSGNRGGRGGHQPNRGQGREPGKKWWEDYYDPSSNINPWERLEQDRHLQPRGSWMSWEEAKAAKA